MFEKVNPSHPDKVTDRIVGAIGDESVGGYPYKFIVDVAHDYINHIGGFEKLAE